MTPTPAQYQAALALYAAIYSPRPEDFNTAHKAIHEAQKTAPDAKP